MSPPPCGEVEARSASGGGNVDLRLELNRSFIGKQFCNTFESEGELTMASRAQWRVWAFIALTFLAATSPAYAGPSSCTDDKAAKAENEYTHIHTWAALHQSYLTYRDCDDGGVAEGYDDAVARLFLRNWDDVSSVRSFLKTDKLFAAFVVRHVNEDWSRDELEKARALASTRCPTGLDQFCRDVVTAIDQSESN